MDASRRGFLRGRLRATPSPLRPPWALAEPEFLAACTRCGLCAERCPTRIIVVGDGGYPRVDFSRGECTFCTECTSVCADGALQLAPARQPWTIKATVNDDCIARRNVVCRSCGDACEARAIRFAPRLGSAAQPEVDTQLCTGCGACVAVCPAQAIAMKKE